MNIIELLLGKLFGKYVFVEKFKVLGYEIKLED